MTSDIDRTDLEECWCCGGLHDSLRKLCPDCHDAECQHFGGDCQSDHKPVMSDGGNAESDTEHTGYTIRCEECGATEHGGRDADLEWDKRYHRMHHCPDADFEVTFE